MEGTKCLSQCPLGKFGDSKTNKCTLCNSLCESCNGPSDNQCLTCKPGRFLTGGKCELSCPAGTWPNLASKKCEPCHSTCATCLGGNNN